MLESVRRIIQKFSLIPLDSVVVIGVSGGADSLALMHLLYRLQSTFSYRLHVATLDHRLRGEDSRADAQFVKQIAELLGVPVSLGTADVLGRARRDRVGIEVASRLARYDFFADVAHQVGVQRVAVAHHAGDQAETVFMHLIRGTGLRGLGGMALQSPMPEHPDLTLIRPLLWTTRAEIRAYCREHDLQPREDVTNQETTILRNFIRLELLPALEKWNPNVQRALVQLADTAKVENNFIESELQKFASSSHLRTSDQGIGINRSAFRELHPALQRRMVAWGAQKVKPLVETLDYQHIVEAVQIALRGRQGARAFLVEDLQLRVDYDWLVIEQRDTSLLEVDQPLLPESTEISIQIPGIAAISGTQWALEASLTPDYLLATKFGEGRLALTNDAQVTLRTRHKGDRFAPLGMEGHHQKLNRWMINHKIPQSIRVNIPLLCVNGEVAALFVNRQWFIGEAFAEKDNAPHIVYFYFRQNL